MLLGSIEAGGTKFVCAVGDENYNIIESINFPTTNPKETLVKTINFFKKFPDLLSIGIASFGPIEVRKTEPNYGYITSTPKPGWRNTDFIGTIKEALDLPLFWTTDVNGSAYGEYSAYKEKKTTLIHWYIIPSVQELGPELLLIITSLVARDIQKWAIFL